MPVYTQSISVIVPVHNGGERFRKCLESLVKLSPAPGEIIVVADADTDGSFLVAKEFGAKVLRMTKNGGPAKARNLGAYSAVGDILFFVDADVTVNPDAICRVSKAFDSAPTCAALIGSYDDEPGESNFLSQYKNLFHHYTHQIAKEEAFTFWGACGAIRREVFLAIGGFDESYRRPSIEDIELGYRLRQAGYQIRLYKDLQVKHLKYWGVISLLKAEFLYRALPWTELILRSKQLSNDLNLDTKSRFSVVLAYTLLGSLVSSWWWSGFLVVAFFASSLLFGINLATYNFFLQKRGLWFALRVVSWHWFYFLYGGAAFAIGTVKYLLHQKKLFSTSYVEDKPIT